MAARSSRRMTSLLVALALPLSTCVFVPVADGTVLVLPTALPSHWRPEPLSREEENVHLSLVVALQHRAADAARAAAAVSDPSSADYGRHLRSSDVAAFADAAAVKKVGAWLRAHGAEHRLGAAHDKYFVSATSAQVVALFNTTVYRAVSASGVAALRCGPLRLPAAVAPHVAAVLGAHDLPPPPRVAPAARAGAYPVTPSVIRARYNVTRAASSGAAPAQAVAEEAHRGMDKEALRAFFKEFVPTAAQEDAEISRFVGGDYEKAESVEALLDVQYIMGVAPGIPTEYWQFAALPQYGLPGLCTSLANWTDAILAAGEAAPRVHALCYGMDFSPHDAGCSARDLAVLDVDLSKLAATGVSIIVASGDGGSGYRTAAQCGGALPGTAVVGASAIDTVEVGTFDSAACCEACVAQAGCTLWMLDGTACSLFGDAATYGPATAGSFPMSGGRPVPEGMAPGWPATSPWVTAVGATRFAGDDPSAEEIATDSFGSAGGFGAAMARPSWQADAVGAYLASGVSLPPANLWNASGRAVPDIALLGDGYQVVVGGSDGMETRSVGGTSAAAPAFAALVSLLNEARAAAGKPPLGFLNPLLYAHAGALTDVAEGHNRIDRSGSSLAYGWDATKGWDPVTGLGTPRFDRLLEIALEVGTSNLDRSLQV